MKKQLITIFTAAALALTAFTGCSKDTSSEDTSVSKNITSEKDSKNTLKKITLNEVAHSIFYAPMYVAIEKGYFEKEGIDLDLVCGFGDNQLGIDIKTMIQCFTSELRLRGVFYLNWIASIRKLCPTVPRVETPSAFVQSVQPDP